MNEPRRLLDTGASDFESTLLRAGRKDAPSARNRRRIAAGLGVGGVFAASAVATGANATARGWLSLAGSSMIRVAGGAVVSALTVYAGLHAFAPRTPAPAPHPQAPALVPRANTPTAPVRPVEPPAPVTGPEVADPALPARPAATAGADTLSLELAALDQARKALASADYALALGRLDDYARRFPRRQLGAEATVLRIEVLAKSGDHSTAARLGKEFLARHPNGPYAKRVSSLIGDVHSPSDPGP